MRAEQIIEELREVERLLRNANRSFKHLPKAIEDDKPMLVETCIENMADLDVAATKLSKILNG